MGQWIAMLVTLGYLSAGQVLLHVWKRLDRYFIGQSSRRQLRLLLAWLLFWPIASVVVLSSSERTKP